MPRPIKPHQQDVLDAFDAGERNARELGRRFDVPYTTILSLLRREGRKLRTRREANASADKQAAAEAGRKRYWTPEKRKAFGDAVRAGHAAVRAQEKSA